MFSVNGKRFAIVGIVVMVAILSWLEHRPPAAPKAPSGPQVKRLGAPPTELILWDLVGRRVNFADVIRQKPTVLEFSFFS